MENETTNKSNLIEKITLVINQKRKLFTIITLLIIIIAAGYFYLKNQQRVENNLISENYVKAGSQLSLENKENSKKIYKEIILSKNTFYAPLALNNIIENNLIDNSDEILKLFQVIESIKMEKENKNLIKLKKSLYLIKISKKKEADILLKEIIDQNSVWKNSALKISNQ